MAQTLRSSVRVGSSSGRTPPPSSGRPHPRSPTLACRSVFLWEALGGEFNFPGFCFHPLKRGRSSASPRDGLPGARGEAARAGPRRGEHRGPRSRRPPRLDPRGRSQPRSEGRLTAASSPDASPFLEPHSDDRGAPWGPSCGGGCSSCRASRTPIECVVRPVSPPQRLREAPRSQRRAAASAGSRAPPPRGTARRGRPFCRPPAGPAVAPSLRSAHVSLFHGSSGRPGDRAAAATGTRAASPHRLPR